MLHLRQIGPFKVLTILHSELLKALTPGAVPLLRTCFFWRSHIYQHCDFLLDSSSLYTATVQSGPHFANAALPFTLAFKPIIPFLPTSYLLSLDPQPPSLAPGCFSTPPTSFCPPDSLRFL